MKAAFSAGLLIGNKFLSCGVRMRAATTSPSHIILKQCNVLGTCRPKGWQRRRDAVTSREGLDHEFRSRAVNGVTGLMSVIPLGLNLTSLPSQMATCPILIGR